MKLNRTNNIILHLHIYYLLIIVLKIHAKMLILQSTSVQLIATIYFQCLMHL